MTSKGGEHLELLLSCVETVGMPLHIRPAGILEMGFYTCALWATTSKDPSCSSLLLIYTNRPTTTTSFPLHN